MPKNLGVIGCGKMAYALIKGITSNPAIPYKAIYSCDISQERSELFQREFGTLASSQEEVVQNSDIVILSVKPGQVKEVLKATRSFWDDRKLLISIAAGIKTSNIEKELGQQVSVVRVMPNTPCLVAEGASVVAGGKYASSADVQLVQEILAGVGLALSIGEEYMDAVTAVSGSGPAYAFLVLEAMIDASLQVGLSADIARQLVLQTFKGSISMLESSGEHPAVLKAQVTSPGGTTIAGLRQMEEAGIRKAFFEAVEKACQRSIELGQD